MKELMDKIEQQNLTVADYNTIIKIIAASLFAGEFGLGSISKDLIETRIVRTFWAGLHSPCKISTQIFPSL